MDEIREEKLAHQRRIENMVRNFEENEAKANESIPLKSESNRTSFGPANDLLRYLCTLEQHAQNDSIEIKRKAREHVSYYIDQFRQSDDDVVEEDNNDPQPNELEQSVPIVPPNSQPPTTMLQSTTTLPSSEPVVHSSAQSASLVPVTDPGHITPEILQDYEKLLLEAEQYEKLYKTIDPSRKKQLQACIQDILNKLRQDTFEALKNKLLEFLNGQEQKVSIESIRISNEEERLLCLSRLATLIFKQLLDSDLTDTKTEIFVSLIGIISANEKHKEFCTIFRDHLYKICPYTIPFYPKPQPTMTEKQYFEAMDYNEKTEGDQRRLRTETEFLNRMSGFIRLFCKLLVRRGPPFDKNLSYAWTWFATVLNLPPRKNITAVLIRIFLDEAGKSMIQEYPTQFPKIIKSIEIQYLPKLKKETSSDQIVRLQLTLDTFKNKS